MAVPVRRPGRIQLQGLHPFALGFHLIWDAPAQPSRLHEECDHWTLLFKTEQDAVWQPFGPDDLPKAYDFLPNLLPKLKKKAQLDADRKVLHLLTHALLRVSLERPAGGSFPSAITVPEEPEEADGAGRRKNSAGAPVNILKLGRANYHGSQRHHRNPVGRLHHWSGRLKGVQDGLPGESMRRSDPLLLRGR
ncbi:hypothetical protein CF327_g2994 [Tilletia walkeri]|nr:hypothetical protein CF327_g2994 [Tilletia walkeri]